jgi:peptidoglycan LD-endopeptidase CwlK
MSKTLTIKPFVLGPRSRQRLNGVDPRLIRVVERAIGYSTVDFGVHEGLRTLARQRELVKAGASKTMNSKHLVGRAVDLVPWVSGSFRWEWPFIYPIAVAMRRAAVELDVKLTWGGIWDRHLETLPADNDGMKKAVNAYVDRRRALGRSAFLDGPHFELKS